MALATASSATDPACHSLRVASSRVSKSSEPSWATHLATSSFVGFGAGCLPRARGRRELALLAAYGVAAGLLYGLLLNMSFWPYAAGGAGLGFVAGDPLLANLHRFVAFDLVTSLGFDIPRAVTNCLLVLFAGPPVLAALRRASRRAAFEAPVSFEP